MATPQHQWDGSARNATDPLPAAHLRTTTSTRILEADIAASWLLKRPVHILEQKPLAALVELGTRREFRTRLIGLDEGDRIDEWPVRLRGPFGESIEVMATVHAARDAEASSCLVYRWTLVEMPPPGDVAADEASVTEPPTMERELRQLAHELNQPLAAIVMYARGIQLRLKRGALSEADLRDALDVVVKQALRATEIVRALDRRWGS